MVGAVPGDPAGDRRLVELAQAGVGHATVIRTSASAIEPADLELALRYLPEIRAIVLVRPDASLLPAATAAATWTAAGLVVIEPAGAHVAEGAEPGATEGAARLERPVPLSGAAQRDGAAPLDDSSSGTFVLEPPPSDPEGTFAGFVAALAVRLDTGECPGEAWSSTVAALAVDPVS